MFDRSTFTLWSNMTGEPVLGPLVNSGLQLQVLPMTLTTWKEWRTANPETTVLKIDPQLGARWGFRYEPGAADQARSGVAFPVWVKNDALPRNENVYAIRIGDKPKAYPVKLALEKRIINDRIGETPVALISNPATEAIRAYERGQHTFQTGASANVVMDENGRAWDVRDDALVLQSNPETTLPRVAGHLSLWFGWYGFFPQSELYGQ